MMNNDSFHDSDLILQLIKKMSFVKPSENKSDSEFYDVQKEAFDMK